MNLRKLTLIMLMNSLTFSTTAKSMDDIIYKQGCCSTQVGFELGEDIKKRVKQGESIFHQSVDGCSMILLDPEENFIAKSSRSYMFGYTPRAGIPIYKVKILECRGDNKFVGKKVFVTGGGLFKDNYMKAEFLKSSSKYNTKLAQVLLDVAENKDDKSYRILLDTFKSEPFASKVLASYNNLLHSRNEQNKKIETERQQFITEIKGEFNNSIYDIKALTSIVQKVRIKAIYKNSSYGDFPVRYSHALSEDDVESALFQLLAKENNIKAYESLVNVLKGNGYYARKAIQSIYKLVEKENKVASYIWFINKYPNSKEEATNAIGSIYKLVEKENNVAGYLWFLENYPASKQTKQALTNLHKQAFEIATDIDTINAWNDFVIAYPTAKQVNEANDRAYELEKSKYVGMLSYFSEEKDARRLLVQSKMLEQSAEDLSSDEKVGYMMVVNRMNDLLKQEFNSTDAALRHLESNEFKSFVRTFKRSMKDLKRQVSRIADNTADLSSIMKQQSSMMNNHFENAAQDREMASELTKQHRHWERFIGEVGL